MFTQLNMTLTDIIWRLRDKGASEALIKKNVDRILGMYKPAIEISVKSKKLRK